MLCCVQVVRGRLRCERELQNPLNQLDDKCAVACLAGSMMGYNCDVWMADCRWPLCVVDCETAHVTL